MPIPLVTTVLFPLLSPVLFLVTLTAVAAEPAFYEPMQFSGPTRSYFFRLPVGQSIVLTAGSPASMHPVLHGGETDLLRCLPTTPSELGSARWECHALLAGLERSEVYFTVGEQKSRILVIQTDPAPNRTLPLPPSALFPDPVLADSETFRNPFPDTVPWLPAGKAAAELYRRGAVSGFPPDGEFRGMLPVNRAEAAKIFLNVRNIDSMNVHEQLTFTDVPSGQWFTPYVAMAARLGVIFGYGDDTFRPGNTVTTAEFLAMMTRAFDIPLEETYEYTDVPTDSWYAPYTSIAKRYDLFPDRSDHLLPHQPLTREEVAVAIYQYLQNR